MNKKILNHNLHVIDKLAYTAGIVDGEGTIATYKVKNGRGEPGLRPQLIVCQKDPEVLYWLKKTWGGRVYTEKPRLRFGKMYDPCSFWYLYHSNAKELVKAILPWLIVKKAEAESFITSP